MMYKDKYDERNQKIVEMRDAGHTWREISETFGLSQSSALNAYNRHLEKFKERVGFEKLLEESCKELSIPCNNGTITRICKCLKNYGIYESVANDPSELNNFTDKYFLSLKNFGEQSLMILRNIK